jgi:acetoin utilization deacetylase AcuC-like enzyme
VAVPGRVGSRRGARGRLGAVLVVFAPGLLAPAQGYSPSAAKPAPVVEAWRELDPAIEIVAPVPVGRDELALAHDRGYVDGVLDGTLPNGFGTRSPEVARSLPWTSGAMLTAARLALRHRGPVAAPVSGFHHAGWDSGDGFCTFNGLVVAARVLLREGVSRIGILDYDYHYGDGTDDILGVSGDAGIVHYTAGRDWKRPEQARGFLDAIEQHCARMRGCDVVLYQAGADPHIDDPLGGFLTTEELARCDRIVFETLRRLGVPVAWNLAGGYQSPLSKVVAIHANTYRAALAAWPQSPV